MYRFRTLKESHPATSSVAFSFDYKWDTISFTLSLFLEITVPDYQISGKKTVGQSYCLCYTNDLLKLHDSFLKVVLRGQDVSVCNCARTIL